MSTTYVADEWEVVDDDGFIFKRRKKPALSPSPGVVDSSEDLKRQAEFQQRFKETMARRKELAILEAQKLKYSAEIEDWQRLLKPVEVEILPVQPVVPELFVTLEQDSKDMEEEMLHLQELQVQVEAYEELVKRQKKLLEHGNEMYHMLEKAIASEKSQQRTAEKGLIEEVTLLQNSPRFLIGGLTSSQPAPLRIKALAVSTEVGRLLAQSPGPRCESPSPVADEVDG